MATAVTYLSGGFEMTDYLKILRLDYLDYSQRRIADSARCSRHTIRKVLDEEYFAYSYSL